MVAPSTHFLSVPPERGMASREPSGKYPRAGLLSSGGMSIVYQGFLKISTEKLPQGLDKVVYLC